MMLADIVVGVMLGLSVLALVVALLERNRWPKDEDDEPWPL